MGDGSVMAGAATSKAQTDAEHAILAELPVLYSSSPADVTDPEAQDKDAQLVRAVHQSVTAADEREEADLAQALERSQADASGVPLSADGIVRFRMTRHAQCPKVATILRKASQLEPLEMVAEAGCEIQPAWAGGTWLFVPLTQMQFLEAGLKLSEIHILIRIADEQKLKDALRTMLKGKRPKLRVEAHAADPLCTLPGSTSCLDVEDSEHIVMERTFLHFRTSGEHDEVCSLPHSAPF